MKVLGRKWRELFPFSGPLLFWLLVSIILCGDVEASANNRYVDELVNKARSLELHKHPAWHALGHYRAGWLGQERFGLIDSDGFYLSAAGKSNLEAELTATLKAFFAPRKQTSEVPGQHQQCTFIARYRWLDLQLDFDPELLPKQDCTEFDTWFETIDVESATLIFPAAYLNNLASMFGHTFLRFDRPNQTEQTRLLSYAVNYGAVTGDDNGVLFAALGLTGGYPGTYSVEPYHQLVKIYSDIENRDIWEYQLDFSTAEVEHMLTHLWELRGHHSDY